MNVKLRGRRVPHRTVGFDARLNAVRLIEQRLLPHAFKVISLPDYQATAQAITDMVVRGAGAIGATAAYGLAQGLRAFKGGGMRAFNRHSQQVFETLAEARPTAVDPINAMAWMLEELESVPTVEARQVRALELAEEFAAEDVADCRAIGEQGKALIRDGARVLTHCNAGWLAFVDIGSATAPIYAAHGEGKAVHVYCDETRPRCQGASLTAWELSQQGVPHTVIADNAAGWLMKLGRIDLVIVGCDRVLGRTGEAANKIGTYTKAVLAKRHGIPFYVAMPLSTIDWEMGGGSEIPIEERSEDEVLGAWGLDAKGKRCHVRIANPGSGAFNPGFDVTPAELITGFITPAGILDPRQLWRQRRRLGWQP